MQREFDLYKNPNLNLVKHPFVQHFPNYFVRADRIAALTMRYIAASKSSDL